jgi:methionyl-tRNA formyltransferase
MRVVVIIQDDPFYLPHAIPHLFKKIDNRHEIVGCILLSASPFGKCESFLQKALRTRRIFGNRFFIRYALRFLRCKLFSPNAMERAFMLRGVPVIHLSQSINAPKSLDEIKAFNPDILISIAGNEIYKRSLIDLAPKGCLNLHTAPLPRYRGLMPTFWVLRFRETQTAVSIFLVDESIDSGPIVVQKTVEIDDMTQDQLIRVTKRIGMEGIAEALDIMEETEPKLIENDAEQASYYGFPTANDVKAFRDVGARFY